MIAVIVTLAVLFAGWCAYDIGFDRGYDAGAAVVPPKGETSK